MSSAGAECVSAPGRGIVDAGRGDLGDVVERDAARRLDHQPAGDQRHGLLHRSDIEVVDQHHVGEAAVQHLLKLRKRVDLDLDLDQMAGGSAGALQHRADAAGNRDVVVLDQDRVVEPEAVVEAAAAAHRVFLERAQPGRGLPGAADAGLAGPDLAHIGSGGGGDAGQMLDEIERHALRRQHRARVAVDVHQRGPGLDRRAVAHRRHDLDVGRKLAEAGGGERQAGDGAGLPRDHHGAARRAGRDRRDRGDVAGAAEILGERARHRVLDLERRDEARRIEQGLDQAFGRPCQHGDTLYDFI